MLIGISIKKIIWTELLPLVHLFFQPVNPMSLHLYRFLLIFLNVLWSSAYRSYTCLIKLIPKYFIILELM